MHPQHWFLRGAREAEVLLETVATGNINILYIYIYMASTDEQSSGLLSWRAARQPEMNQQIFAGIVQSQWLGFVAIDVCFEEHGQ